MQPQEAEPRPLCLVGPRGSGKTTVGRALASRLGRPFKDLDAEVEARLDKSVRQIFAELGQSGFRELESRVLQEELEECGGGVFATGGGSVLERRNRQLLGGCFVVFLDATPEVLARRVESDPGSADRRPPLFPGGAFEEASRVLAERRSLYEELANLVVDASAPLPDVLAAVQSGLGTPGRRALRAREHHGGLPGA